MLCYINNERNIVTLGGLILDTEEMISKKDLLKLTGISYGQLYRWKRQKLIPDSWFIKQSVFTGQETFFPKDKILKRIETIIELKDQYSLDELAKFFSEGNTNRVYSDKELKRSLDIPDTILDQFIKVANKKQFTFLEAVFIHITCSINKKISFQHEMDNWIQTVLFWCTSSKSIDKYVLIYKKAETLFYFLLNDDGKVLLDKDTEELCIFHLAEQAKLINLKLEG